MKSLSCRNNNPGNIIWGDYAISIGAQKGANGFAKFNSPIEGTSAMLRLLAGTSYRNRTIRDVILRYAPPVENKSEAYIAYVMDTSGVDGSKKLRELSPFDVLEVIKAMIEFEGWNE